MKMKVNVVMIRFLLVLWLVVPVWSWLEAIRTYNTPKKGKKRAVVNNVLAKTSECRKDRHCQPHMFCHRYDGVCRNCHNEGQLCRRNKMCCRGMECAAGKCRRKVELGREGALCRKDRDCNYNLCCAREKGQNVCKRMLGEGDVCGLVQGGASFLWSHQCQCGYGLKCKSIVGNVGGVTRGRKRSIRTVITQLKYEWRGKGTRKVCVPHHKVS